MEKKGGSEAGSIICDTAVAGGGGWVDDDEGRSGCIWEDGVREKSRSGTIAWDGLWRRGDVEEETRRGTVWEIDLHVGWWDMYGIKMEHRRRHRGRQERSLEDEDGEEQDGRREMDER